MEHRTCPILVVIRGLILFFCAGWFKNFLALIFGGGNIPTKTYNTMQGGHAVRSSSRHLGGLVKVSPGKQDQNFKVFQTYVDPTLCKEKNTKSKCNKTSAKKKDYDNII